MVDRLDEELELIKGSIEIAKNDIVGAGEVSLVMSELGARLPNGLADGTGAAGDLRDAREQGRWEVGGGKGELRAHRGH